MLEKSDRQGWSGRWFVPHTVYSTSLCCLWLKAKPYHASLTHTHTHTHPFPYLLEFLGGPAGVFLDAQRQGMEIHQHSKVPTLPHKDRGPVRVEHGSFTQQRQPLTGNDWQPDRLPQPPATHTHTHTHTVHLPHLIPLTHSLTHTHTHTHTLCPPLHLILLTPILTLKASRPPASNTPASSAVSLLLHLAHIHSEIWSRFVSISREIQLMMVWTDPMNNVLSDARGLNGCYNSVLISTTVGQWDMFDHMGQGHDSLSPQTMHLVMVPPILQAANYILMEPSFLSLSLPGFLSHASPRQWQ